LLTLNKKEFKDILLSKEEDWLFKEVQFLGSLHIFKHCKFKFLLDLYLSILILLKQRFF
jgi:hypothetical protein